MIKTKNSPDFKIKGKEIIISGDSKLTDPVEAREFYKQIIHLIEQGKISSVKFDLLEPSELDLKYINDIKGRL